MASRKAQNKQEQREQYRLLQKVRKESKHHRKEERVRQKGWLPGSPEEWDALAAPQSERVMPRGERDRRRANLVTAATMLAQEANGGNGLEPATAQAGRRGTVVEVSTALYRVSLNGSVVMCGLRGGLSATEPRYTNVVAVGDEVIVSEDGAGSRLVERVLPRRSVLARPDFARHLQQVIVANVDQLLIVASWREPAFWFELVDRYLIAAARSNLSPIICVNKVDLAEDRAACRDALRPYLGLGYRVLFTSAVTGEGLDELKRVLWGRTTALAGLSGVGKSSLLAAVEPGLQLRIAEVSDRRHEGRHTTTQVSLIPLQAGGFVADTPGIREFGLSGLQRGELGKYYPEFAALAGRCRFADCSHTREPGCAVKAAVREGRVAAERYSSYRKIYAALPG